MSNDVEDIKRETKTLRILNDQIELNNEMTKRYIKELEENIFLRKEIVDLKIEMIRLMNRIWFGDRFNHRKWK